ncbi:protein DpdH [Ilumatobacter fluminis]|nr:protein DpdH [Ilumatobacter fluminis]
MRRYVCWQDEAVLAATPRDAASLDPEHFQAVHHPLRLRRRPLGTRSGGRWVEEREIVEVLSGALRPDGYLLVPVVGGSGTGKSHLVRWVFEHTRARDGWETRYLAKNRTSLRRVIEIVIEGLEGHAIDDAREALTAAPAQNESEQVLGQRLLDELAIITSEESREDNTGDERSGMMLAKLERELPDILRDPVVRRRLTREGAVIPRLVGLAHRGRRDGDGLDDDAMRVVESDLPLAFEEIGQASGGAQRLLTQMASHGELRKTAVRLINEALPVAVKRVFVSGQVDLIEVFREVRRALLAEGKELVLFIEDLTVLHGVEREFLDAIVEPARSPDGELCPLRVLFAVTEGHFDGLDTVRTRCDDAYWLDATYGAGGVDEAEARSFVARYLNATRLQPEFLQDRWVSRSGATWLPNACDGCHHQTECHATFGASTEGYGLYPFNEAAVDRFTAALSSDRFDPREVVRELINRFLLIAGAEVQRDAFPSDELVAPFNHRSESIDPVVETDIRAKRPVDASRTVNTMRYWSPWPQLVSDDVLGAFGISALEGLANQHPISTPSKPRAGRPNEEPPGSSPSDNVAERLSAPWSAVFVELAQWVGSNRDLSMKATNEVRKLVHKIVMQNLDWSVLPVSLGAAFDDQKRFDRERHIRVEGSVTDQTHGDALISIRRSAEAATALQGLILLQELPGDSGYARAGNYRWLAAQFTERWTQSVADRLSESASPGAQRAVEGLLVSAMACGACESAKRPVDYLLGLFEVRPASAADGRSDEWRRLVEQAETTHRRLRPIVEAHFAEARGSGGARAVRADQLLVIIQQFVARWSMESEDAAIDRFMRQVQPAVNREWMLLSDSTSRATDAIDLGRPWAEQFDRVLDLVETAHKAGRLTDYDAVRDLRAFADLFDEDTRQSIKTAERLTRDDEGLDHQLRAVASALPETMYLVGRYVERAERALESIAEDLGERPAGGVAGEDESLQTVAADVLEGLNNLTAAIEAATT